MFSCQSSEIENERDFSVAGDIYTAKSNSLNHFTFSRLMSVSLNDETLRRYRQDRTAERLHRDLQRGTQSFLQSPSATAKSVTSLSEAHSSTSEIQILNLDAE